MIPTADLALNLGAAIGNPLVILFTALRVAVVFIAVLLFMRLSGKRVLGQFSPLDLVTLLLISNAVQNAMIGPDTSLAGGLVAAATILWLNHLVSKSLLLRNAIEGAPTILVQDGQVMSEHLSKEGVSLPELEAALREHGVAHVEEVSSAVLEVDGTISVCQIGQRAVKRLRRIKSSRNR